MFGMKFGGEKKPVSKVETKEGVESQIEQEAVKLDANLESLKADIAEIGGIDKLKEMISKYTPQDVGIHALNMLGLLGSTGLIIQGSLSGPGVVLTTAGVVGGVVTGSVALNAVKNWWENRKLKSLKNKAEEAGIASNNKTA